MKLSNFSELNNISLVFDSNEHIVLSGEISRISIVTFPGNLFWVKKDDFVFISLDFVSNEDISKILKIAIEKKVIGCCLIYNNDFNSIDNEIISLCDQSKLPLFKLKKDINIEKFWLQVLSPIIGKDNILTFFEQQLKNNIICLTNSSKFNNENLTYLISFFLHRDSYLLSNQFTLLCHGNHHKPMLFHDLPLKKWSEELSKWKINESYSSEPVVINFIDQDYYCFPLKMSKNIIGYFCIEKYHPLWGELNLYFISEVLPNFILCMIDKSKNELTFRKPVEEYLQNVLYGLYTDINTLKRESTFYHFEYHLNRYVWILQIKPLNKEKYPIDYQISKTILTKVKNIMEQVFYKNTFLIEKSQIVSIHVKDDEPNKKVLKKFDTLLNNLELQCPEYNFCIGISRSYSDIYQLKYAYEDAVFSLTMGKIFFSSQKKVFSYDDLLIYHFLYQQIDSPILERLYVNTIQKVKAHDLEKQDQLYETLNTLINNDFNIKQTYENLFIHRNTLYQRIKKIETIIGLSMKSSETKLLLQLGLKLDHIYTVINRSFENN